MTQPRWLRNVRPYGSTAEDLLIENGRFTQRRPASTTELLATDIDGQNQLLTPALVESHVHLDKTLWGQPWRPNSAGPTLKDYIANERRILREVTAPIAQRAGALLENCIARGSLTMRCHVDIDPEFGLRHVEAMQQLREKYRDLIDLQLVVFPQTGLISRPGTAELMREAMALGVENVGGLDPCGIDNDPIAQLDFVFKLASEFDRGVDIHLHDKGELGLWQIALIADYTERFGLSRPGDDQSCLLPGHVAVEPGQAGGRTAGGAGYFADEFGAGRLRGAAVPRPARDRGECMPGLGWHSRRLVAHGQRRHAGTGDVAGVSVRLEQGRRTGGGV